jgi:hypothetical protein
MRGADLINVDDLSDKFLLCRTLGHSWDDNPNPQFLAPDKSYVGAIKLRCTRCRTERYDYIDKRMEVWKRFYRYPKGYGQLKPGYKKPQLRAELFNRSLLVQRLANNRKRAKP